MEAGGLMTEDAHGLTMFRVQVVDAVAPAARVPVTFTVQVFMYSGLLVTIEKVLVPAVKVMQFESSAVLSERVEVQVKAPHPVTELVQSAKLKLRAGSVT